MKQDNSIKIKYQLDTDTANCFIDELTELVNKYQIRLRCENSILSFDLAEIIKVNEIVRLKEEDNERNKI